MAKRMQYGEQTVVMRVPKSMVGEVKNMMEARKVVASIDADLLKENPVVSSVLDAFMAVCAQQMAGVIASMARDLRKSGDVDGLAALQTMIPYFEDMAFSGSEKKKEVRLI